MRIILLFLLLNHLILASDHFAYELILGKVYRESKPVEVVQVTVADAPEFGSSGPLDRPGHACVGNAFFDGFMRFFICIKQDPQTIAPLLVTVQFEDKSKVYFVTGKAAKIDGLVKTEYADREGKGYVLKLFPKNAASQK